MEKISILVVFVGFSEEYIAQNLFPALAKYVNIAHALEVAGINSNKTYKIGQISSISIIPGINNHVGFALARAEPVLARLKSPDPPDLMNFKKFLKMIIFNSADPVAHRLAISILANANQTPNFAGFLPKMLCFKEVRLISWTKFGLGKK